MVLDACVRESHNPGMTVDSRDAGSEVESNRPWVVIRSKAQRERIAVEHLKGRGADVYCPLYLKPRRHMRAPRRPMPLFPGYLFARSRSRLSLNGMAYCPGVHAPLRFDGVVARVEDALIQALRAQENESGFILPWELKMKFEQGRAVTISEGPLKGMEGVFQGYLNGMERARVLVDFLHRKTQVEIQTLHLKVVS